MTRLRASLLYEQEYLYLTGLQEPDCALILLKDNSPRGYKMTLFVEPNRPDREVWDGPSAGLDGAVSVFGADEALPNDPATMLTTLKAMLSSHEHVYVDLPAQMTIPRQSMRTSRFSIHDFLAPISPTGYDLFTRKTDFESVVKLLSDRRNTHSLVREMDVLRSRKSANEIRVMRHAGAISGAAMAETMRAIKPGMVESEGQAVFEYACARRGAERQAYVPVFASGRNALMIHYVRNDALMGDRDVLSVDAGCEFAGYASDITRTMPIAEDGKFTPAQRDVYEALLRTLKGCTELVAAKHGYSLAQLHRFSVQMLHTELKDLGFQISTATLERVLYPHYVGHWLGIDLHDTSTVERCTKLEEGMVLTIEPGIYIPDDPAFPKLYRGIGMRVEDDVAVGYGESIVLSADAPKEVVDIEAVSSGRIVPRMG
ncbi:hypothetical protein MVES_002006 [Malassezia vespertilionis]|uniref:Aminopeptidase P N-terminal domain-containing protein n=1 Tax=Malassezia vespertilionis TaxID=2020962 RepID=A0A2N1JC62_9BASI|nr:hypothetical protein MVES_002006 [Malassezia vespertilionis]